MKQRKHSYHKSTYSHFVSRRNLRINQYFLISTPRTPASPIFNRIHSGFIPPNQNLLHPIIIAKDQPGIETYLGALPSTTSKMVSLLQALPDEILLKIIKAFAENPKSYIFFPQYCVLPGRYPCGPTMEINYPYSADTKRYCSNIPFDQKRHAFDWLVLNTTSRTIRRLGREVFYSTRSFAMTMSLPDKLQQGVLSSSQNPRGSKKPSWKRQITSQRQYGSRMASIGQWLDPSAIRRVMFVNSVGSSTSALIGLPRILRNFNRPDGGARYKKSHALGSCILIYGFDWEYHDCDTLEKAVRRRDTGVTENKQLATESKLSAILHELGTPKDIHVLLAFAIGWSCDNYWWNLDVIREAGLSTLRIKAAALREQGPHL